MGRRGLSSELTTALAAAQQNMSSLHKQLQSYPACGLHAEGGGERGSRKPASPPLFFFSPLKQTKPEQLLVGEWQRAREMTQVFCNLSHLKLQFGGRKEQSKIVSPTPACITQILHPIPSAGMMGASPPQIGSWIQAGGLGDAAGWGAQEEPPNWEELLICEDGSCAGREAPGKLCRGGWGGDALGFGEEMFQGLRGDAL